MAGKVFEHPVQDDGGALTCYNHGLGIVVEHFLGDPAKEVEGLFVRFDKFSQPFVRIGPNEHPAGISERHHEKPDPDPFLSEPDLTRAPVHLRLLSRKRLNPPRHLSVPCCRPKRGQLLSDRVVLGPITLFLQLPEQNPPVVFDLRSPMPNPFLEGTQKGFFDRGSPIVHPRLTSQDLPDGIDPNSQ